jgi:hypothetical protein
MAATESYESAGTKYREITASINTVTEKGISTLSET